jgi:hypothetical protein
MNSVQIEKELEKTLPNEKVLKRFHKLIGREERGNLTLEEGIELEKIEKDMDKLDEKRLEIFERIGDEQRRNHIYSISKKQEQYKEINFVPSSYLTKLIIFSRRFKELYFSKQ